MLYRNVGEYQSRVCKIFERRGFQRSHRPVYVSTQEINTHFMCLTLSLITHHSPLQDGTPTVMLFTSTTEVTRTHFLLAYSTRLLG